MGVACAQGCVKVVAVIEDPEENSEPVDAATKAAISAAAARIKAALETLGRNGKLESDEETGMVADVVKLI